MKPCALAYALLTAAGAAAETVYVECESFGSLGGWTVETQSMRQLGSSYVMAHGYGTPVADAETEVEVPADGRYSVWARTRNWNAEWTRLRSDCKGKPDDALPAAGRFRVVVDGTALPAELGVGGPDWCWHLAGAVDLRKGKARIALRDLAGFNGRCDAICLTTDGGDAPERARQESLAAPPADDSAEYDVVVCGGGIAGCCAALAASRYGLSTLLLQDRGVLGGCNSSEIRVSAGGFMHTGPYPALGNVLEEILPVRGDYCVLPPQFYEDDRKANAFSYRKPSARLMLNKHVFSVETNLAGRIVAVLSRDTLTARTTRHRARWFVDATGDGVIARLAGCATMYGREERSRWNEACAPEKADRQVMGHSIQWTTRRESGSVPFPDIDWGLEFDERTVRYVNGGTWWQEAGQYRDMAEETEAIRDYGLLAIFSNWSYVKNRSSRKASWANAAISWVSPVGGKRESHRVYGDYVLTEADLEEQRKFPDGTAVITWDIDFHFPDPENERDFPEPFRSCAYHRGFGKPVAVPYRCLYARDVPNLFLAGRDISVSHGAFAAVRVQRTLGMLGEVVGIAAGICREKGCDPRGVYEGHLAELVARMKKGVPKLPQYVAFGGGMHEKYHFADLGFVPIWPNPATNVSPRTIESIRALKMNHRHKHPLVDGVPAERRRLVLADESRGFLHYYDSSDPDACFSVKMEKPVWDLERIGEGRYRTVCRKGFQVVDIAERRVVDTFRHDSLDEATSVCDLPDGGFLVSVNPRGAKEHVILVRRFSKNRDLVSTAAFRGIYYGRGLTRLENGDLLLAHEKGFAICRMPLDGTKDADGEIVKNVAMPKGRNLFEVVPNRAGTGYWAGAGYGAQLLRFDLDGNLLSSWTANQGEGKKNFFYAQIREQPDGHVYVANWTGHGANDSNRGWQVIEFDEKGNVVWHLDDPARFGSIHGVAVVGGLAPSSSKAKEWPGFAHGMGIGGWLTNYKRFNVLPEERRLQITQGDLEHFDSYITEADVRRIKEWGFDHIRLGFDQIVLEEAPGKYRERTFRKIDEFIGWCGRHKMNVVLNLHKAVGNYCDIKEEVELLDDDGLQRRFIDLWFEIERRYHDFPGLAFEILNEVRNVDPEKWNNLADRTLKAIREKNPDRWVVIGSTCWNSPGKLKNLKVWDDPKVVYTFHLYAPFEFTHQRGVLQHEPLYCNMVMEYPSDDVARYRLCKRLGWGEDNAYQGFDAIDRKFLAHALRGALDFVKAHPDKILWNGEFGTIRHAPPASRVAYMRDVVSICKEAGIPYCVWNYLSTPNDGNRFSLVDDDTREFLSQGLLRACLGE